MQAIPPRIEEAVALTEPRWKSQALARGYWEAQPRSTPEGIKPGGIAFRPWYALDFTPAGAVTVTWDNGISCTTSPATISRETIEVTVDGITAEFRINDADEGLVTFWQGGQYDMLKLRKTRDDPRVVCY